MLIEWKFKQCESIYGILVTEAREEAYRHACLQSQRNAAKHTTDGVFGTALFARNVLAEQHRWQIKRAAPQRNSLLGSTILTAQTGKCQLVGTNVPADCISPMICIKDIGQKVISGSSSLCVIFMALRSSPLRRQWVPECLHARLRGRLALPSLPKPRQPCRSVPLLW